MNDDKFTADAPDDRAGTMQVYTIMGVSGSGKSTIGRLLARKLDCPFYEGDDYHPPANIEKMANGTPLRDEDRQPWIAAIGAAINADDAPRAVLACSALTVQVRDWLRAAVAGRVQLIYPKADRASLLSRLENRKGHYFKSDMLDSQLETLEEPSDQETFLTLTKPDFPKRVAALVAAEIRRRGG